MSDFVPKKEFITTEEQLRRWAEGDSVHQLSHSIVGDQCCPDFSCCKPELKAEESVRKAFVAADQKERMAFLGHFLGAMIQYTQKSGDLDPKAKFAVEFDQEKQ